jgi:hypothetical protein
MIPLVTLRELFAHNYWARDRAARGVHRAKSGTVSAPHGQQLPFVTGHPCAPSWRRMGMARTLPRTLTAIVARRRGVSRPDGNCGSVASCRARIPRVLGGATRKSSDSTTHIRRSDRRDLDVSSLAGASPSCESPNLSSGPGKHGFEAIGRAAAARGFARRARHGAVQRCGCHVNVVGGSEERKIPAREPNGVRIAS